MGSQNPGTGQSDKSPAGATHIGADHRLVGIEVEFGGLTARQAACIVHQELGGYIREIDAHRFSVEGTRLGTLRIELDSKYVHSSDDASRLEKKTRRIAGELGNALVPTELVTEPLPASEIPAVDQLIKRMKAKGALGTQQPHLACGLHLNIAWSARDIASILRVFRAYLLMSPCLRSDIGPDTTRTLLPFISRFSRRFENKVLDPDYDPDLRTFIADYCHANPSKNRELDLLPLLASLDREAVAAELGEQPPAVRPAFHYRLPNADFEDPDWSIQQEWQRWLSVEALANDESRLSKYLEDRRHEHGQFEPVRALRQMINRVTGL